MNKERTTLGILQMLAFSVYSGLMCARIPDPLRLRGSARFCR